MIVGFWYHPDCGPAEIGKHGIPRRGTLIYGDVQLGDYFQSGHNTVIRAKVRAGDHCTVSNQSTLDGIIRMGRGLRPMSHVYVPSRTWFGDHVFVGPGVTFLNSRYPGRIEPLPEKLDKPDRPQSNNAVLRPVASAHSKYHGGRLAR